MVDAIARRRSENEFARQDSKLDQDRYGVSNESADFGSQGGTPLVQYTSQSSWHCASCGIVETGGEGRAPVCLRYTSSARS
jgi:hypothetical protein